MKGKRSIIVKTLFPVFLITGFTSAKTQGISPEQNYAMNAPGVAMVQTVFSATVSINKVEVNERRFQQLVESVQQLDTTGKLLSSRQKLDIVVRALYRNPVRYLSGTNEYFRQKHRILSSGTGFFITGDGYLVTNCHIIDRDSAYIKQQFILSTFKEVTEAHINSLESAWEVTLTAEQKNLLADAYSVIYSQVSSMILFDLQREIYVLCRTDNGTEETIQKKLPARVIRKGKAMPGKDVAILKVDSVSQMPTLSLNMNRFARIGEQVFVYGYPEPATSNAYLAPETNIDPTLTAGVISASKKSIGGWPVLQMDAVITHGSSGSPVCDKKGEVIGLATFGSLEQNTGELVSGYNFAIPVSIIMEFIDSAEIEPALSQATIIYNRGVEYFFKEHYARALSEFEEVQRLNKSYPQLTYYINICHAQIRAGQDKESFAQKTIFRVIAFFIIITAFVFFYRWKTRH
jgi:serine protease Do